MNSKAFVFAAIAACAMPILAANPSVSGVSMAQAPDSFLVTVGYTLADGPAIVTFDVQTNRTGAATADEADWLSIGDLALTNAFGDVNCMVESGVRHIHWRADDTWNGNFAASGAARAVVTAWSTNTPPDYLVVDLRRDAARPDAAEPRVKYYVSTNALPLGGIDGDAYRNSFMVMRRIPSQGVRWCMGSPATESGHAANETQHYVTFTEPDYYMSVFEMTFGQMLNFGTTYRADNYGIIDIRLDVDGSYLYQYFVCYATTNEAPLCSYNFSKIRGSGVDWLVDGHTVESTSLCGIMRERTGVDFDIPTEAQWEYAFRAGSGGAYNDGTSPVAGNNYAGLLDLAWFDATSKVDGTRYAHRVGTKAPNAWGLYDMSGNMFEWCLDWHSTDAVSSDAVENPKGPTSGTAHILKGGSYSYSYSYARASSKTSGVNPHYQTAGMRPICPVCLKWPK